MTIITTGNMPRLLQGSTKKTKKSSQTSIRTYPKPSVKPPKLEEASRGRSGTRK